MQIRVKNLNKGGRGVYVGGTLMEVNGGETATFNGATAAERDAASEIEGLKVQSRAGQEGDWTDHFKEDMPEEKPWFAIASDMLGSNFKPLTDLDGNWVIGMAVAGERPDSAAGYKWVKVGSIDGGMEAPSFVESEAAPVEPAKDDEPIDYAKLVEGNAADVIKAITAENAAAIGDAEEKREGGPRNGVMKAVEKAIGE